MWMFCFSTGSWNDANCGRANAGYVCKKYPGNDHTPPPPTASWEGNCPEGMADMKQHACMNPDIKQHARNPT